MFAIFFSILSKKNSHRAYKFQGSSKIATGVLEKAKQKLHQPNDGNDELEEMALGQKMIYEDDFFPILLFLVPDMVPHRTSCYWSCPTGPRKRVVCRAVRKYVDNVVLIFSSNFETIIFKFIDAVSVVECTLKEI